jgi:chemotaxis protein MotB
MIARWGPIAVVAAGAALAGCITTQSNYDELQARYEQSQAANRQLSTENTTLQQQLNQQGGQNTYTVAVDMLFTLHSFELSRGGQAALDDIGAKLRSLHTGRIVVSGYTDSEPVGAPLRKQGIKSNAELSAKRAEIVASYLRGHGVDSKLLSAKGRGEARPVASNDTPGGRAKNRRIEISVEGPAG